MCTRNLSIHVCNVHVCIAYSSDCWLCERHRNVLKVRDIACVKDRQRHNHTLKMLIYQWLLCFSQSPEIVSIFFRLVVIHSMGSNSNIDLNTGNLCYGVCVMYVYILVCTCGANTYTHRWADPLFWLGARRPLEQDDLYAHPQEADSEKLLRQFNRWVCWSMTGHSCWNLYCMAAYFHCNVRRVNIISWIIRL